MSSIADVIKLLRKPTKMRTSCDINDLVFLTMNLGFFAQLQREHRTDAHVACC